MGHDLDADPTAPPRPATERVFFYVCDSCGQAFVFHGPSMRDFALQHAD